MKYRYIVFMLLFLTVSAGMAQNVVNQVKLDTLKQYVRELSGDKSYTIGGTNYTITSRLTTNKTLNYQAADYLKYRLRSYGLTVTEQPFTFYKNGVTYESKNIYAEQTGTKYPAKKYIICAHFDAVSGAPGADDNGSGTSTVLEAARIISKLSPECTIVYALWNGEEQGLYGSKYYAGNAAQNNVNVAGVINVDMIAWDADRDNVVEIYYFNPPGNELMMSSFLNILYYTNEFYNIGLNIRKLSTATANSDHYYFLYYGSPAFLMIEENGDFNSYYHSPDDKYSNMNLNFMEKCAKLAIGALAEAAAAVTPATAVEKSTQVPEEFALYQNYPNPFNPSTVISYSLKAAGYVNLKVFDLLGREVATLVDQYQPAGKHQVDFSMEGNRFASGVYLYELQAGNLCLIRKMVFNK